MPGSQDYYFRFLAEVVGRENLEAISFNIGEAAKQAKVAKDASEAWGKILEASARAAGVSVSDLTKQLKVYAQEQKVATDNVDKYRQSQEKAFDASIKASKREVDEFKRDQEAKARAEQESADRINRYRIRLIENTRRMEERANRTPGGSGGGNAAADFIAEQRQARIAARIAQRSRFLVEQEEGRAGNLFGRVGGRVIGAEVLGRAAGIPGGGFIGSQVVGGLGLSGGAAIGLGAAAVGLVGAYGAYKAAEDTAKYAQEQSNLAKELGLTVQETQLLGRVTEVTGLKTETMYKVVRDMNKEFLAAGPGAKRIQSALEDLGLSAGTAFIEPRKQLDAIFASINKIGDEAEKKRALIKLFGESGLDLLPLAENFKRISEEVKKSGVILSDESINRMKAFKEYSGEVKLYWTGIAEKIGESAVKIGALVAGGASSAFNIGKVMVGAGPLFVDHPMPAGLRTPAEVQEEVAQRRLAIAGVGRLSAIRSAEDVGRDPVEVVRAQLADLEQDATHLRSDAVAGTGGGITAYTSQQSKIRAAKVRLRAAEKLRTDQDAFGKLQPLDELNPDEIAGEYRGLVKRFPEGTFPAGSREAGALYNRNQATRDIASEVLNAKSQDEISKAFEHLFIQIAAEGRKIISERITSLEDVYRTGQSVSSGEYVLGTARASRTAAIASGTSRYGFTPSELASRELALSQQSILTGGLAKSTQLGTRIAGLTNLSTDLAGVPGFQAEEARKRALAELDQAELDLKAHNIDVTTKSIDAINKFNDSIDKVSEGMRAEFAGGFTSILLGAQRGGRNGTAGQATLDSLRGFGEKIEGQILTNVGGRIFGDPSKGTGASGVLQKISGGLGLPDWLTSGTILGHVNAKLDPGSDAVVNQSVKNTDRIVSAITGITGGGSGGVGSGSSGDFGGEYTGGGDTATSVASGVGTLASSATNIANAAKRGGAVSAVSAFLGSVGKLGKSFAAGISETGDWNAITNNYEGETRGEQVGAIVGTVGVGLGIAKGIEAATKGGLRNVSGGIGTALGAAAAIPGPQQPFIAGGAAIAGLVAAFSPDPREVRGREIEKRIFTQQYLAPPSINMGASGTGGYADFDISGGVRNSRFSPYPIEAGPYLDVPRRTVVPGGTIGSFGGAGGPLPGTGAQRPQVPTPITINIHAMDAKSFTDNADKIVDAAHHALLSGAHPLVHTLRSQLGLS